MVQRAAIIGMGMVAPMHIKALADSATVELAGVYCRDPAKAGGLHRFDSIEAIAVDPQVDFAILLTPPSARVEICETLVRAGKPILIEKPIERSLAQARGIVALTQDVPTGVVFQHRFRDVVVALKQHLENRSLGEIGAVEIIIPWWRAQSYYDEPGRGTLAQDGGGVLTTQAIHVLDLITSLLGPITQVQAMAQTTLLHDMETEDFVAGGVRFASGFVGSLSATTASFPGGSETIRIHGTLGSAELNRGTLDLRWRDGRIETMGQDAESGGGADPMAFKHIWHQAVIEDFADALQSGRDARCTAAGSLGVHALIEALLASSAEGRIVDVEQV